MRSSSWRHTQVLYGQRGRIAQRRRQSHRRVHGRVVVGVEQFADLVQNIRPSTGPSAGQQPWGTPVSSATLMGSRSPLLKALLCSLCALYGRKMNIEGARVGF